MADYSDIRGYRVKYLSSDPTLNESTEGQVWYNSTSGTLKSLVQIKAWSSGGNASVARYQVGSSTASQNAGLVFGGRNTPTYNNTDNEEYSGYAWSTGGTLNTGRSALQNSSIGSQTAGLAIGGYQNPPFVRQTAVEEYDGSTWTSVTGYPVGITSVGASGTQTSGLVFGGFSTANQSATNEYNGSAWTAGGNLGTARYAIAGTGIQTATVAWGGSNGSPLQSTEEYDGTSWASSNDYLIPQSQAVGSAGIQTSALAFGGVSATITDVVNKTFNYDGTNWTTSSATLGTARATGGSGGTANAALFAKGDTGPTAGLTATEEYNSSINSITQASWASGGNVNTPAISYPGGAGIQTAGLKFGGRGTPPTLVATEEYDGATWTNGGNMGTGRYNVKGSGTQTSALGAGGYRFPTAPTGPQSATEEYDGSTWTAGGALTAGNNEGGMCGTQTASVFAGGAEPGGRTDKTQYYDGTSWTTQGGTLPTGINSHALVGSQTSALFFGGDTGGPTGAQSGAFTWNGTSWTTETPLPFTMSGVNGMGIQTNAVGVYAGPAAGPNGPTAVTQWNGTGWVSITSSPTSRQKGLSVSSNSFGGVGCGSTAAGTFDEFTEGSETATASTLTTS